MKIMETLRVNYQKLMNEDDPREGISEQQVEVEHDIVAIEIGLRNLTNGNATGPDNLG